MRSTRTWMAAAGVGATVALATGCTAGSLDDDPDAGDPGASPGQSASPSPSDEPAASPQPESVVVTTQNGTASFTLPADWTVRDTSGLAMDYDQRDIWANSLVLVDGSGADRIAYSDPLADGVGVGGDAFELVQTIPLQDRVTAAAWWVSSDLGDGTSGYTVQAALIDDPAIPSAVIDVSGGLATVAGVVEGIPECATVDSEASAVACLESDAVTETLEVLATFERHDVPEGAMP